MLEKERIELSSSPRTFGQVSGNDGDSCSGVFRNFRSESAMLALLKWVSTVWYAADLP